MKIFFQNRLIDARRARLSLFDHGFLYGDGIYETLRAYGGRLFRWRDHEARLRRSAKAAGLSCPWTGRFLRSAAENVVRANRAPEATVRICVTRGQGPLGLDPSSCSVPTLAVLMHPHRNFAAERARGVEAAIIRETRQRPHPWIKSASALPLVLAKAESRRRGSFEGVLVNPQGMVTEGTVSNIFFVRRGRLHTPDVRCGLLAGITRARVIALARTLGIRVTEGRYRPNALRAADEVFLTNTSWEIVPVVALNEYGKRRRIAAGEPGPLTKRLQRAFFPRRFNLADDG